eukprot:gene3095-601_t
MPTDTSVVTRRLQSELMSLMMAPPPKCSAFPENDNILTWAGTITGPDHTPYEGLEYKLAMSFEGQYPYKPPTVKFDTPVFHPNVDLNGGICLDILKEEWSPSYSVTQILLSIQSLLGEPNNASPLNTYAAGLWANAEEFTRVCQQKYKEKKFL